MGKISDPSVGSPKSPKQKHRGFGGWWFSFISFHSNDGHQNLKEFANCLFGGSNSGETPSESIAGKGNPPRTNQVAMFLDQGLFEDTQSLFMSFLGRGMDKVTYLNKW